MKLAYTPSPNGAQRLPAFPDPGGVPVAVGVGGRPAGGDAHFEARCTVADGGGVSRNTAGGAAHGPAVDLGELAGRLGYAGEEDVDDLVGQGAGLVVAPSGVWTMATTRGGDLAYLTMTDADTSTPDQRMFEVMVVGHGRGGDDLADRMFELIRRWDRLHRAQTVHFALQPVDAADRIDGQFTVDMPHHRLAVTWQ